MAVPQFKAVLIATPQMRSESGLTFRSKQSAVWPADPRGRRGCREPAGKTCYLPRFQCLDATCYHAKLTEHVNREVAARPELVQIETAHRNPKERRPGTLSRHEYTEIPSPEDENEGAEPVTPWESSKTATIAVVDHHALLHPAGG